MSFDYFSQRRMQYILEKLKAIFDTKADTSEVPSVIDNLTSTSTTDALSAKQGKTLKDSIDELDIPSLLSDLSDVELTSLANGQIIKYNGTSQKWLNSDFVNGHNTYFGTSEPSVNLGQDNDIYIKVSNSDFGKSFRIRTTSTGGESASIAIDTIIEGTVTSTDGVNYRWPSRTYSDFTTNYYSSNWHVTITSNNVMEHSQGEDISWGWSVSKDMTLVIDPPVVYGIYIKSRGTWIKITKDIEIVDNLTTNDATKALSAKQGKVLKDTIDGLDIPDALSDLTDDSTHRLVTDAEKTAWNAKANIFVINVSQDEETENLICDKTPSEVATALTNNNIIQVVYVNDVYENEIYTLISDYLDSEDKIIFGCTYENHGIEIYSKTLTFYRDWSEDDVWESIELSVSDIVSVLRAPIFRINNAYSCIINYTAFKDAIENDQSISVYYNGSEYNSFKYDSANKTFYFSNTITESNHTTTKTFVMVGNNSGEWSSITMNEVTVPNVEDSLTSTSTADALSAKQGKVLKDAIDGLNIPDELADLSDDSTHRLVTDTEKTTWNNKSDFDGAYNSLTGKPTLGTASAKDVPTSGDASTTQVVMGNDTRLSDSRPASDVYSWAKAENKPTYNASEVGAIATTAKGTANGVAELDSTGKVPSAQLPSYVDDVIEGYYYNDKFYKESTHETEIPGESGKIYVDLSTDKTYRWSGTAFTQIKGDLTLGETSSTAYRGDRGKTAYDHSQTTSGNPHNVTKSDVGLGNVGNFKAVSTEASQGLTDTEKSNARTNIGAGTSSFSGSYTDLSDKPTLGTAAAKDVAASGNASATQVVMGNDTRLTDSRTPTAHNQASNTINAMTGYSKPSSTGAIGTGDTLNGAIGKLEKGLDGKTAENPTFTEASSRANIASGESFATILGKIKKFFSDLKTVAFTGNASDLTTDSTHRLVTDTEKTTWHNKVSKSGDTMTGTLNITPPSGEGGEIHLNASTAQTSQAGINLDQYGSKFRIFGIASADGTTKVGTGTPICFDPYDKTITGGYTFDGTAAKATSDSNNDNIVNTYLKQSVNNTMGAKNVLPLTVENIKTINTSGTWNGNIYTISGITFTLNTDNDGNIISITTSAGTPSEVIDFRVLTSMNGALPFDVNNIYILTGCASGGSGSSYKLDGVYYKNGTDNVLMTDYGSGAAANLSVLDGATNIGFRIILYSSAQTAKTFYPMLRLASYTDSTFEPYAKTNLELTSGKIDIKDVKVISNNSKRFSTINGGKLESCVVDLEPIQNLHGYNNPWVGGSGKNKLPMTVSGIKSANTSGTWSGNVYTQNDVTFTVNTDNDGNVTGIKINGTASANIYFYCDLSVTNLPNGNYIISGGLSNYLSVVLRQYNQGGSAINTYSATSPVSFTLTRQTDDYLRSYFFIASGVAFNNNVFTPMIRLASVSDATFEPYTNICGITGHSSVEVTNTGKNLLPLTVDNIKNVMGSSGWTNNAKTINGITMTILTDFENNVLGLDFNGTSTAQTTFDYIPTTENIFVGMKFNGYDGNTGADSYSQLVTYQNASGGWQSEAYQIKGHDRVIGSSPKIRFGFLVRNGKTLNHVRVYPMIRLATVSDATFEPYQGQDITVNLGGTYYGGTLDVVSGELTITHGIKTWDGSENWSYSSNSYRIARGQIPNGSAKNCNLYKAVSENPLTGTNYIYAGSSNIVVYDANASEDNLSAWKTSLGTTNLQLVYELVTPIVIQLTPQQINTLIGENNLDTPLDGQEISNYDYRKTFVWDDIKPTIDGVQYYEEHNYLGRNIKAYESKPVYVVNAVLLGSSNPNEWSIKANATSFTVGHTGQGTSSSKPNIINDGIKIKANTNYIGKIDCSISHHLYIQAYKSDGTTIPTKNLFTNQDGTWIQSDSLPDPTLHFRVDSSTEEYVYIAFNISTSNTATSGATYNCRWRLFEGDTIYPYSPYTPSNLELYNNKKEVLLKKYQNSGLTNGAWYRLFTVSYSTYNFLSIRMYVKCGYIPSDEVLAHIRFEPNGVNLSNSKIIALSSYGTLQIGAYKSNDTTVCFYAKCAGGSSDFGFEILDISSESQMIPVSSIITDESFVAISEPTTNLLTKVLMDGEYSHLLNAPSVINNLTSTSTTDALSAAQGKALQDGKINVSDKGTSVLEVVRGVSVDTSRPKYWAAMINTNSSSAATTPTTGKWWHVLNMDWDDSTNNWVSQLALATQDGSGIWWRRNDSSNTEINASTWHRLAEGNAEGLAIAAVADKNGNDITTTYLPLSGGAISAPSDITFTADKTTKVTHNVRSYFHVSAPKYTWHDLFAFCRKGEPTFYVTSDNINWTESTLDKLLFSQLEGNSINIIKATGQCGARWVWDDNGFAWSSGQWLLIGNIQVTNQATINIKFETSSDGTYWTTRHQSTTNIPNSYIYCFVEGYGGDKYLRLTITKDVSDTEKTCNLSGIKLLSNRLAGQGGGQELESPLLWDKFTNVYPYTDLGTDLGNTTHRFRYLHVAYPVIAGPMQISSVNNYSIDFRPEHANYDGVISYETNGNEAMLFTTKNPVTSFMFVNGEDIKTNHSDTRWQSLTPGLQIKNNCVAIGKLIPNGTTPTHKLDVNGNIQTTSLNGVTVGDSPKFSDTITEQLYKSDSFTSSTSASTTVTATNSAISISSTTPIDVYSDVFGLNVESISVSGSGTSATISITFPKTESAQTINYRVYVKTI